MDNKAYPSNEPMPNYAPDPAAYGQAAPIDPMYPKSEPYAAQPPQQYVAYQTPNNVMRSYPVAECCCGCHVKTGMMIIFILECVFAFLGFFSILSVGIIALAGLSVQTILLIVGLVCGFIALRKDEPGMLTVYLVVLVLRMIGYIIIMIMLPVFFFVIMSVSDLERYLHDSGTSVDVSALYAALTISVILMEIPLLFSLCLAVYYLIVTRRCQAFMSARIAAGLPPTDMWGKA